MTMRYFAGFDFGTGGCKITVIDTAGRPVAEAAHEYPTCYPHPGWSEQDPDDWFPALCGCLRDVAAQGVNPASIAAVSLDGSTHNAVLLDSAMRPVRRTVMWTDQRSAGICAELAATDGDRIFEIAYQAPTPTWTLPQLRWLKRNEPETFAKIRKILFVKDYVRFLLTGEAATDYIEAQGTLFFDMRRMTWSEELASLAGVEPAMLPPLLNPADPAGRITAEAARLTGLSAGCPVICGASDSAVEDYGAGAVEPGDAVVKLATAGNFNVMTAAAVPNRRTLTYSHVIPGMWYTVTATNAGAVCLRFLRDRLAETGTAARYPELDRLAAASPPGANGVMFHPYLSGERSPYWDSALRASFTGLGMNTGTGDMVRAVLEGVAFSLRDCRRTIEEMRLPVRRIRLIGGGARSFLWSSIVRDVMNTPLSPAVPGDASFGSALLAGCGVGAWRDPAAAVRTALRENAPLEPDAATAELYDRQFARYRKIHDALQPIYSER